ncbi:MAG: hypothetical protein HKN70_08435 [Gammaproteobacteria bacterium]|nr:hypothetical protein [Gammaproteobacteria bacterium]
MKSMIGLWSSASLSVAAIAITGVVHTAAANEEVEWDEAELFFELNNTDGDLGIHANIDGGPWKKLDIEDPRGKRILKIKASGRLGRQGMTQLEWESAEPTFDELSPTQFFRRFPEGVYEIEGETLEGEELESEVEISHVMAAPVGNVTVNSQFAAASCDADVLPVVSLPVAIDWDPVTESHPDIGTPGVPVAISRYQLFVERDDVKFSVDLDSETTEFPIPDAFLSDSGVWKYEIIARTEDGNNTAIESCFFLL